MIFITCVPIRLDGPQKIIIIRWLLIGSIILTQTGILIDTITKDQHHVPPLS